MDSPGSSVLVVVGAAPVERIHCAELPSNAGFAERRRAPHRLPEDYLVPADTMLERPDLHGPTEIRTYKLLTCSAERRRSDVLRKTDGQRKMKRLRSRKERSQMRGGGREASKSKAHHHHHCCHRQSGNDQYYQSCFHSSCHCPPRREAPLPNVIPAAQEPSIITDSRLIGHHGLFNHEVKSIDIERLLTERRKLKKSEQQGREKNNATARPSSTCHRPSPLSTNDLSGADADEVLPLEKKTARGDCQEKEEKTSHGSDITPGQRTKQPLGLSSGSFKSISSSKHSSLDEVMVTSEKADAAVSEKGRGSQPTPAAVGEKVEEVDRNVVSTPEHTPKNQESPVHQTQAPDPDSVSRSVSAVAARLCGSLQFPLPKRRNLAAESREVLLNALWERHGPRLQENLLQVQRCLSVGADPAKKVQDQEPTWIDDLFPPDAFATAFRANTASRPCFDSPKTASFEITGSKDFNWKSRPQPRRNLEQPAEWLTSPVNTSVSLSDDILRPTCAPQFCMDFELTGETAGDRLFSPASCWGAKASVSPHWEDRSNMYDSFESSFMNNTGALPERSGGSRYSGSNIQPFLPYLTQRPAGRSAEPMHFRQVEGPFETDRYSFAPSFSGQMNYPQQSFQPLPRFSHPSTCPPLTPHHTDMIHYPPSHMLDRDPAAPLSSFPSPESWSFPPMRLY